MGVSVRLVLREFGGGDPAAAQSIKVRPRQEEGQAGGSAGVRSARGCRAPPLLSPEPHPHPPPTPTPHPTPAGALQQARLPGRHAGGRDVGRPRGVLSGVRDPRQGAARRRDQQRCGDVSPWAPTGARRRARRRVVQALGPRPPTVKVANRSPFHPHSHAFLLAQTRPATRWPRAPASAAPARVRTPPECIVHARRDPWRPPGRARGEFLAPGPPRAPVSGARGQGARAERARELQEARGAV
jgi:hypothetical protein